MNQYVSKVKNYVTTMPKWILGIAVGLAMGLTVVVLDQKGVFKQVADKWRLDRDLNQGPLGAMDPAKIVSIRVIKFLPGKKPDVRNISDPAVVKDVVSALSNIKPSGIARGTSAAVQLVFIDAQGYSKSVRVNEFVVRQNAATSALAAQWETPESVRKLLK